MLQDPWNRPLPPDIILGGEKRFNPPLPDPSQSWVVSGGSTSCPTLEVKSRSANQPGGIILQVECHEGSFTNPSSGNFSQPAFIDRMSWDWIEFHYNPLEGLGVEATIWVPDPRVICGIHHLHNKHSQPREITLTLTCQTEKGQRDMRLVNENLRGRKILFGGSKDCSLALFVTGSMPQSPGPSNRLKTTVYLEPGGKTEIRWILIYCNPGAGMRTSLEEIINLDWEGEIARRKILLSHQLQIKTGNLEWDFSLAFSQRQARLFLNQLILQAESRGQADLPLNPFQAWQLLLALTPQDSSSLEWLLKSALRENREKESNFPLEAELLWRAHLAGSSQVLLREFLPGIERNLATWFSEEYDKDKDGIPEGSKENPFQLESNIQRGEEVWSEFNQGDGTLESPGFAALLQNEIRQLLKLQSMIPGISITAGLNEQNRNLEEFILDSWKDSESRFRTRDYQSHLSEKEYLLPYQVQNGWNILRTTLPYPSRLKLLISRTAENQQRKEVLVTLQGIDWLGRYRVENLTSRDFLWQEVGGWSMTRSIFSELDYCNVVGLGRMQPLRIIAPGSDRQDLSLLFPLWCKDLPADLVEKIVTGSLTKPASFWSEFGLKSYPAPENSPVQLPLNLLVLQGLISAGHAQLAREIFIRCLDTISMNLRRNGGLYSTWESKTGSGLRKQNDLESLLPIGLLLDLLGVRFLISGDLILEERNPLIFPVHLVYRGVEITLQEQETILSRPGGEGTSYPRGEETVIPL